MAVDDVTEPAIGVNVVGYFTGTLGIGEAARLYVRALRAAQVPVSTTTAELSQPKQDAVRRLGEDYGRLAFGGLRASARTAAST